MKYNPISREEAADRLSKGKPVMFGCLAYKIENNVLMVKDPDRECAWNKSQCVFPINLAPFIADDVFEYDDPSTITVGKVYTIVKLSDSCIYKRQEDIFKGMEIKITYVSPCAELQEFVDCDGIIAGKSIAFCGVKLKQKTQEE